MKPYPGLFFTLSLFITACSCQIPVAPGEDSLTLMTWNVQNLFDEESSGREYDDFDPEKSDWGEDLLRLRLENMKEVIESVNRDGPDILFLQEVENQAVLNRLNREYLEKRYPYSGAWEYTDNAVRCGFLSRIPPQSVHLHFPGEYGSRPLRPVLEIRFCPDGEELIVLNNHWKSRSGGVMATEEGRLMSARVVSGRVRELKAQGHKTLILAGDFNGSCSDYRPGGSQTSQIPIEYLPDTAWPDSLYIAADPDDYAESGDRAVFYSPWDETGDEGSYFYQNRWMRLDHFLLTGALLDGRGWEFAGADCLNSEWLSNQDGHPLAWQSWTGSGYSDHFPLLLFLNRME